MIVGAWCKLDEVSPYQLKAEKFTGISIRTTWIDGQDNIFSYTQRLVDAYEEATKAGFTFFLVDYSQGMGKVNKNFNYEAVADRFQGKTGVCFYIGEPYEEFIEKKVCKEWELVEAINEKIKYVKGNVFIDSTKRNSKWLKRHFSSKVKCLALSSYWRQQTEWSDTTSVWISGQLGCHILSSWRYKSLSSKAKDKEVVFLYQFNPSSWSKDGWENKVYETFFNILYPFKKYIFRMKDVKTGKQKRIQLERNRRLKFIKYFSRGD